MSPCSVAAVVLVGVLHPPARVDNHLAALEKAVRDGDRLIERPAGVVAQVQHQSLHAFAAQLRQRLAQFTSVVSEKSCRRT